MESGPSSTQGPRSLSKHHHPYFSVDEVEYLSEKQRGKLSTGQEEKARQQACGFIELVGTKIGFPRKTIATAQSLYHRFHLFFPRKDFHFHDVSLAAIYVSSKMHDTLKKPREILMSSYLVRFPEVAARSKSIGGDVDMDPQTVEQDRQRLLAVERLILETICFNFTSRMAFPYVIKLGRTLNASKALIKLAWRLSVDVHRTLVPIQYPPHVVALGAIYTAALLACMDVFAPERPQPTATDRKIASMLQRPGPWEDNYMTHAKDLDEIAHLTLDLLIQAAQNPSANTSPRTPSSPSPHPSPMHAFSGQSGHAPAVQIPYKADSLIQLKITLRENEAAEQRALRPVDGAARADVRAAIANEANMLGRNEGTVRFLFAPESVAGAV
ncbi:cyclin-like protein [Coniophora puteana RWD-64-598 SS2]|uniref:Cyclin-like protein n=1 Tax=Coniophora puteana (strain RWD-64-598) TaxID=741705 RepID=A0A5M3MKL1_CONPW|nr:cyclin-like protein [Coniophora puteana RWD-64-598 SS2]EIW79195.1 cyclin-like protein [Coniophora puteana RWD-64-598 SS2]